MAHRSFKTLIWSAFMPLALGAQGGLPPVREINLRIAQSADSFGLVVAAVQSNGAVTVVDHRRRRIIRMDPTLAESVNLFDAAMPAPLTYPTVPPVLFLGQGDTVYMTDLPNRGVRVIAPSGEVRRLRFEDGEMLSRITSSAAGAQFGTRGDMFYAATLVRRRPGDFSAEPRDSLYLVHVNFAARRTDTLGFLATKRQVVYVPGDSVVGGSRQQTAYFEPFWVGDAIAMNSRGELAVIRVKDFHVDWLLADGTWKRSPPVQWAWKRYTDAEKKEIFDERTAFYESGNVLALQREGTPRPRVLMRSAAIPDTEPPFAPMSAIADQNGLIWLELTPRRSPIPTGKVTYGAIDSSGQIVDRISLPADRRIIGFSKTGYVYAAGGGRIEVYRLR
jgi:hypothetical protein